MKTPNLHFILVNREPVDEPDLLTWAMWMETADRLVARDTGPGWEVSTVFLGVNYRHMGKGAPLLFETAVFAHNDAGERTAMLDIYARYATWHDAECGHAAAVERKRIEAERTPLVREATIREQFDAIVATARQMHANGATHDCGEWIADDGRCRVCDKPVPEPPTRVH